MRRLLLVLPCLVLLTACAATNIETQRLPAANAAQPLASILVFNARMKLANVKLVEAAMAEEFAPMGVKVEFGLAHLPFDGSPEAVFAKAAELPVEGLLIVTEEGMNVEVTDNPPVWVEGKDGKPGYYLQQPPTETYTGAYSAHLYTTRVKGKMEQLWIADIDSRSHFGPPLVYKDVGRKVAQKLAHDGMIVDNRPKK